MVREVVWIRVQRTSVEAECVLLPVSIKILEHVP
jgi:hypothetical protein